MELAHLIMEAENSHSLLSTCWDFKGACASWASQVAVVKNPPANAGDLRGMGSISGGENLLEEEMATHSSILA